MGCRNSAPGAWSDLAGPIEELEQDGRRLPAAPQDRTQLQPALQRPVQTDQGGDQDNGAGDAEPAVKHDQPRKVEQNDGRQAAEKDQKRRIDRLAAVAVQVRARVLGQLPLDARLVEQLHQVALDQTHQHQAFLEQGQVVGGAARGDARLLADVHGHLSADQPDQQREEQERQRQPEVDRQREGQQQGELHRLAEDDGQPGVQGVVDRLDVAGEDTGAFARPQGAEGQRAQAEGVMVDGPAQRVVASRTARAAM